jgi:hypothetical protein
MVMGHRLRKHLGRSVMNRVTKAVDRNAGKTRKKPGWNIIGCSQYPVTLMSKD